jgi:putative transposase
MISTSEDKRARLRAFVVQGLDALGVHGRGLTTVKRGLDRLWREQPEKAERLGRKPSVWSARRWLDQRGTPGERPLRQMLSMTGLSARSRRLPLETVELMRRGIALYWACQKWSIKDAYAVFYRRLGYINHRRWRGGSGLPLLKVPSFETFRLGVRESECHETYTAKYGRLKADKRFKPDGKGLTATRALQIGCMDHTQLDSVVALDSEYMMIAGRPWVTALIDVRTRCVVGFVISFEPPSLYSVMECIKRANRPKAHLFAREPRYLILGQIYGRFDEIVVDNGWEFAGNSFEDALNDAGVAVRWAPVRSPTYKAVVERFFGTLNKLLAHKVPGAVYKPDVLREMGYDPYKDTVLTLNEIEDLLWEAICVYHKSEHTGIGVPPASLWQRDAIAHGIDVIGDDRLLDKIAGQIAYPCTVSRAGVTLFGLQYHDRSVVAGLLDDLVGYEPIRGQARGSARVTVKVKYNPANIAEIHVWNQKRRRYATLPCLDEQYAAGLTLWHHKQVQAWAKSQGLEFTSEHERLTCRARLAERIQSAVPGAKARDRRAQARLLSSPKIEAVSGSRMVIDYAPARHDGLAPVIVHEALAPFRTDGGRKAPRPAKGGRNRGAKASQVAPAVTPTVATRTKRGGRKGRSWNEVK